MNSAFKESLDGHSWEQYCEKVLRREFSFKNFVAIPHHDRGDHGLEFYTYCGIIFQCYRPDPSYSMEEYRRKVKAKVTTDLGKLKKYEKEISDLLGKTVIKQWVLMIPENKSRELIKHCKRKEKEIIKENISFIDNSSFKVQVETDDSFPSSARYARIYMDDVIDLKLEEPVGADAEAWKEVNSTFYQNLCKKTDKLEVNVDDLRNELIRKYMTVQRLLDIYRDEFPDLHDELYNQAAANLEEIRNENLFIKTPTNEILSKLLQKNREIISKLEQKISVSNKEVISSGFVAQWLAECNMDFVIDE